MGAAQGRPRGCVWFFFRGFFLTYGIFLVIFQRFPQKGNFIPTDVVCFLLLQLYKYILSLYTEKDSKVSIRENKTAQGCYHQTGSQAWDHCHGTNATGPCGCHQRVTQHLRSACAPAPIQHLGFPAQACATSSQRPSMPFWRPFSTILSKFSDINRGRVSA